MDLLRELRAIGWYLSETGLKKLTPPNENVNEIIKLCLDTDFREIAEGALAASNKQRNENGETLKGPIVLQVQSIRNISAPKITEKSHGPRMLCVELSDGQTTMRALELQKVQSLDMNTPPGTKIRFRADKLELLGGYLLLKQPEVQVLGGHVAQLVEKWEVARTLAMYARSGRRPSGAHGPPPWLAFGKSLNEVTEISGLGKEKNFKSLQAATEKDKDNKENEEFNAMRNEAIAEAAKTGTKKVFGGGGQQILDHNIKKILDKGYSEEEARQFLRATNNNLERALYNLKRRQDANNCRQQSSDGGGTKTSSAGGTRAPISNRESGSKRGGGGGASKAEEANAAKPATNVSLFDFLTDKLPANAQRAASATEAKPANRNVVQATASESNTKSSSNSNSINSNNNPRDQQRNQYQTERQSDAKSGRYSEPRQQPQSGRPFRNDDSKKHVEHGERNGTNNSSSSSSYATFNKQNGRGGGRSGSNRNNYDNRDENNRRSDRNERNAGGNRKPHSTNNNSNNNYQQTHEVSTQQQSNRINDGRSRNDNQHGRQNSNRNQQQQRPQQQQQQQQQYSNNSAPSNQKQSYSNQRSGRPQAASSKQQNTANNHNQMSMNVSVPPTHHQQQQQGNYADAPPTPQAAQANTAVAVAATAAAAAPTLLPNGFVYDPSKIIGFQSKEANEYALNLMRSQGKTIAIDPNQTKTLPPPPPQATVQQQSVAVAGPTGPQPPPLQFIPQPVPLAPMAATMHVPHHFAMATAASMQAPTGEGWSWKVGDLCMAKYWDDGQYYEAEITGISDKTCVVYYINYGNHEEVLKADCLPITDAHHRPINNYSLQQQMVHSPQQQQQHQRAPMRYYVPPHKRNN